MVIPIAIAVLAVYLFGLHFYTRRAVPIQEPAVYTGASAAPKTEQEEDEQLALVTDKININTATISELTLLDGIGEALAERIVQQREALGGFNSIEQLKTVKGIGDKLFESIQNYIKVE